MDNVLKALTRNRLSSDTDQEKPGGDAKTDTTDNAQDKSVTDTNHVLEESLEDDEKKVHVSIDCTKALVIFGFSNWSELEPGKNKQFTVM